MKKKLIYVAGYGRSGSTLLERILASHDQVCGLGEACVFYSLNDVHALQCACGQTLDRCEQWSKTLARLKTDFRQHRQYRNLQMGFESLASIFNYISGRNWLRKEDYAQLMGRYFDGISESLPSGITHLVDSSKTQHRRLFRPLALSKIAKQEVFMIHLVRDGRSCISSLLRGSNRKMEAGGNPSVSVPGIRGAIGWCLANLGAHLFQALHGRDRYCRVRYEDLVDDYAGTLARLAEFLDINLAAQIEMLAHSQAIPQSHQLGGNRLRFTENIVMNKGSKQSALTVRHRLVFGLLNIPLNTYYGYSKR